MQGWLIAAVVCVAATACSEAPNGGTAQTVYRPQQAGPTHPLATSGHLAGIEVAGLSGDQRAMCRHVEAMRKDMMRSMHLPDPARPIDHEAARAAVRPLQGVQSIVWIDRIRRALEPLGDTLGVVVNLQDVTATTSEGANTLSQNCQLRAGERAMLQQKRQVDVLDQKVREPFSGAAKMGQLTLSPDYFSIPFFPLDKNA